MRWRSVASTLYRLASLVHLLEVVGSRNPARLLRYAKNRAVARLLFKLGVFR